jgi:hypothetical protein
LGCLLSHFTVCPGVSVGVQAARAGSTGQVSTATASAQAEAVERKRARKCSGTLTICRDTTGSHEDADRIIDVSRPGMREPEGWRSRRRVAVLLNLPLRR